MGESISPNDLIFGGDYCESDKDKECLEKVIATISANEEKFKVFHKSDYEIYEIICFNMSQVYNDSILELYRKDPFAFALLISTFFGQQTCLGTDQNGKTVFGKDEARKERYDRLGDHWERTALRILDELYEYNPEYATIALKIDYREKLRENNHKMSVTSEVISQKRIRWYQNCVRWYSDYLDCKYNQSRELMSIAYFANASQFLSHYTCRDIVNNRANSRKLWLKWLFNLIFRLLYVVLFAIILIFGNPWHDTKSESESKISKNTLMGFWVYIMLFLLAQTLVSFLKLVDKINVYQLNYNSKTTFEKFLPKKRHLKFARRYLEQNTLSMFRMMLFAILFIFEAIRLMLKVIPRKSEGYENRILRNIRHISSTCIRFSILHYFRDFRRNNTPIFSNNINRIIHTCFKKDVENRWNVCDYISIFLADLGYYSYKIDE
ncbi:unnamed protein product [Caenorhabditis angaria]|uniref:Uncharacterized protein n=1 Tax=Caenorhabditis angaria TaxID=860376 RepID=A0A9P1ISM6_9PELO|nr:unnamed protein product [Caenorhabditis angaria]